MNQKAFQRIFEIAAVALLLTGAWMTWKEKDPFHYFVYGGFIFLATAKLIEAIHSEDPSLKTLKISICFTMYAAVLLSLLFGVTSIAYMLLPLGAFYLLQFLQRRKA